jgi:hypothetical protein
LKPQGGLNRRVDTQVRFYVDIYLKWWIVEEDLCLPGYLSFHPLLMPMANRAG